MDFDNPAQLEGIGEDDIIIGTDVSQQGELHLTATGDYGVSTPGGSTHFTLEDPTQCQSVVTTQDGVMRYLIQGTEASGSDMQHEDCLVEHDTIAIPQENLSIQVPSLVKVNVPTIDSSSGLTTTQSVYITLSQDGQVTVKKEAEEELEEVKSDHQVVAQDGNVTLVNVSGNSEITSSSKTQSSLVQLTQDGKVNIVSRTPTVAAPRVQLQQVMLPNGAVAYFNTLGSNTAGNAQLTMGNNSSTVVVPNASKDSQCLESESLDDGSITYITASMVPPEAADLGDTTFSLAEATSLQKVTEGEECSNGSEDKTVELVDTELTKLLADQGSSLVDTKMEDRSLPLVEKAFKCPFNGCDRFYTTVHHLKVHERTHTGDKPYHCSQEECGKSFATAYGLKSHTRIHTGEKPYKCPMDQCTKAFKTSGDLQKHIRTHTGEKPFKCPFEGCDKAFTTSNIRKVHIRVHTGERPYVCPVDGCGKSFSSATNYKNHVRIHTGERPYVCTVQGCGKKFTEYSSLYKHHVVHTHAKPYVCQFCGKTYRQTSTLAMHIRTAHGEEANLPETEYVLARDRIFTVGVEDNEGALVINTAEPNQGSGSTSNVCEKNHATPTSRTSDTSTLGSNINVIQAPSGGSVMSLPSELQGQRVFVITEPAQLQLLQQLTQSSQFPSCKSDGLQEECIQIGVTEQMDTGTPSSPGLVIGSVNESEISL